MAVHTGITPAEAHAFTEDGAHKIMIAVLCYLDDFAKIDGSWLLRRTQAHPRLERDTIHGCSNP
jgi:hypothetical protein